MSRQPQEHRPEVLRRLALGEVELAVRQRGSGSRALVLVHGWGSASSVWDPLLGVAGPVPTVRLDLRGHGCSPVAGTSHTVPTMASDVLAVIDRLGLDDVVLVGHSMGANVALAAARQQHSRVRGVVAVDPAWGDPGTADTAARAAALRAEGPAAAARGTAAAFAPTAEAALVASARDQLLATEGRVLLEALHSTYTDPDAFGSLQDTVKVLATLGVPLLSIYPRPARAEEARMFPVRDHTVVEVAGSGHFIPLEQPVALWVAIRTWLRLTAAAWQPLLTTEDAQ